MSFSININLLKDRRVFCMCPHARLFLLSVLLRLFATLLVFCGVDIELFAKRTRSACTEVVWNVLPVWVADAQKCWGNMAGCFVS